MTLEEVMELWVKVTKYAPSEVRIYEFAALVAEKEREVVANWIMDKGFATGHGDSIFDLLDQLEWQIAEKEREAIWNIIFEYAGRDDLTSEDESLLKHLADLIKARGNT